MPNLIPAKFSRYNSIFLLVT